VPLVLLLCLISCSTFVLRAPFALRPPSAIIVYWGPTKSWKLHFRLTESTPPLLEGPSHSPDHLVRAESAPTPGFCSVESGDEGRACDDLGHEEQFKRDLGEADRIPKRSND
jgi:hypothetical protein